MTEFEDIERRLREQRPELSALELDEVKTRVRRHADRTPGKGQPMKSRFAIMLMLVAGMLLSTTGAGLAVTGFTDTDSASVAQYGGGGTNPDDDEGDIAGEEDEGGTGGGPGDVVGNDTAGAGDVQPTRQVAAAGNGNELPFTGFAAIPVLIGGVALLSGGLVLRRHGRSDDDA